MQVKKVLCLLVVLICAGAASASVVFTDGFEGYNNGALDKNASGGANAAPNGSGNPWFGPSPPNAQVVGTDSGVSPHSGSKMIRGAFVTGTDSDQNWYNLAYRHNGGVAYTGNIQFDWWFYDAVGQGAGSTNFRDYAAIGYYNTAPSSTDHPSNGSLNTGASQIQRLSLGGYNGNAASQTVYCARVVGETAGDAGASTWFLTGVARSPGWHHGQIVIGPAAADKTNQVIFNIDGAMALTRNTKTSAAWGYNILEFNSKFGSQTGYFDDVTFSVIPEPASLLLLAGGMLLVRRRAA